MATIALERGSRWEESIDLTGAAVEVVAYGQGALPVLDGSSGVAAGAWEPSEQPNVYRTRWQVEGTFLGTEQLGVWRAESARRGDVALQSRESLSALEENLQTYTDWTQASEADVFIYASQDPRGLPDGTYRIAQRATCIRMGPEGQGTSGGDVSEVHVRRPGGAHGAVVVGRGGSVRQVLAEDVRGCGVRLGSGLVEDTAAWEAPPGAGEAETDQALFTTHLAQPTGEESTFRRTRARSQGRPGYGAESSGSARHSRVVLEGVTAEYCSVGVTVGADATVLRGTPGAYAYAAGCAEALVDPLQDAHTLEVDELLVRALPDGSDLFLPNEQAIRLAGGAASVTLRNCAIVMDRGMSVVCEGPVGELVLENCVLVHTDPAAPLNARLSGGTVTVRNCIVVGGAEALLVLDQVGQYIGENNVFVSSPDGFRVRATGSGPALTTLQAWYEETGQDFDSLVVPWEDRGLLFEGDVTSGDLRLRLDPATAGARARELGAGLRHEISAWPGLPERIAEEQQRLATPETLAPLVRLHTPHIITVGAPTRIRFEPTSLTDPLALRLRWLVDEILSCYPDAETDLDIARCLRDWISRIAIHPFSPFHWRVPLGMGNETLPQGYERRSLLHIDNYARTQRDSSYWNTYQFNGYGMLCDLLGLDNSTGNYVGGGQTDRIGIGHWRVRDVATYNFVLCSYQDMMLIVLQQAAGLHGMLISTLGHDPAAVWISALDKWVYNCPTFNETYTLDGVGDPLSPVELLKLSRAGYAQRLVPSKSLTKNGRTSPVWSSGIYLDTSLDPRCSYIGNGYPDGFRVMGGQVNMSNRSREYGPGSYSVDRLVIIDVPDRWYHAVFNDENRFAPCKSYHVFPYLGCSVDRLTPLAGGGADVHLLSGQPGAVRFERKGEVGDWASCGETDTVLRGAGRVRYRSLDANDRPSSEVVVEA